MTADQTSELIYLGVLIAVLLFWFVIANRNSIGKTLQYASAWGLIFIGAVAVVGLWDDIRGSVAPRQAVFADEGRIELPRAPNGHYYADLIINGAPIRFVVDTGATSVVLTKADAEKIGLDMENLAFLSRALTANGEVKTAPVTLDTVALGSFEDRNIRAFVNGGELDESLLGMTYLQSFERLEISNGKLVLER